MAYIDQDNSRDKTVSGVIAITLVGAVGYALVSGLALSIVREPPGIIPGTSYPAPPPPPTPRTKPVHRTAPTTHASPSPPIVPVQTTTDTPTIQLGAGPTVIDLGPVQPALLPSQPVQPSVDHTARAIPKGRPGDWVTSDYYPASAIRAGVEGRSAFRLDIGIDGHAAGCTITSGSGSDELDRTACRVLVNKARFTPARNAGGDAIASTYSGAVNWKLPAE